MTVSSSSPNTNMTSMSTPTEATTATTPPLSQQQSLSSSIELSNTSSTTNTNNNESGNKELTDGCNNKKEPTIDDETEEEEEEENDTSTTTEPGDDEMSSTTTNQNNNLVIANSESDTTTNSNNSIKVQQTSTATSKRDRDNDSSDCDHPPPPTSSQKSDDDSTTTTTTTTKKKTTSDNHKRVKLDSSELQHQHRSPTSIPVNKESSVGETCSSDDIHDVAELARLKAAKFIQERTKMACLLPSASSMEAATAVSHRLSTNAALSSSTVHSSGQTSSSPSSRKRKLTVKDILVSQRNRNTESVNHNKQQRIVVDNNPPSQQTANHPLIGLTNQMFGPSSLGQILDPGLQQQMNDANPLAAISAALAAAAAASSSSNGSIVPPSNSSIGSGGPSLVPDSQSAYISTLASTLSSNPNPTAAFAIMASLSAMMQQQQQNSAAAVNNNNNNNKDNTDNNSANNPISQLSNSLVSLESTLANTFTEQSHSNVSSHVNNDEDDENNHEKIDGTPLDFSLKNSKNSEENSNKNSSSKRKSKKNFLDQEHHNEEEFPLDLSVSNKKPDESSIESINNKSTKNPLSSLMSQVSGLDGSNGENFAAMAAAAAAAAAAASFSPNLLTRMAASISPWSNYGLQGLKLGNEAANAAFSALFQQVNQAAATGNPPTNSSPMTNVNKSSTSNNSNNNSMTANNLFQPFPDLYWNGKIAGKTSTVSPSFGGISNSTATFSSRHHHHPPPPAASQPMRTKSSSGRQNPWQAQWINRSSEQTRDVFTCVWCKESFKSLAEMTDHMKRSPRCGMAGMQQHHSHHNANSGHNQSSSTNNTSQQLNSGQQTPSVIPSSKSMSSPSSTPIGNKDPTAINSITSNNGNSTTPTTTGVNNIGLLGNATKSSASSSSSGGVNMPRKLVRGQDVWLGRGAEQTRQILKCMWCGQSFKSLADMTQHMKITQHYTNIISQEQIISWRNPEEKLLNQTTAQQQQQVNAVLTCKVCDEPFSSLKDLSNHMVKNSHFKDANNSDTSTPPSAGNSASNSNKTTATPNTRTSSNSNPNVQSDRRKKSLPVRKLLELERGESKKTGVDEDDDGIIDDSGKSQLIECDDCHEKIEARCFLQHIKQCRSKSSSASKSELSDLSIKNGGGKSDSESEDRNSISTNFAFDSNPLVVNLKKTDDSDLDEHEQDNDDDIENSTTTTINTNTNEDNSGNVLSALEKLIEKNFDTKSRRSQQTGILQRLGIDEEVFPPWQNMTPSPMASAISPSMMAAWNPINGGVEFSRSSSSNSSSNNSRINSGTPIMMPQLRYRRNSSSLKEKYLSLNSTGATSSICKTTTESNGSFSSQETEEESCDDSNSECGNNSLIRSQNNKKKQNSSRSSSLGRQSSRLNFPISSMLSSPIATRPTSASSTASSISPSEPVTSHTSADLLNRLTPNSHRSNGETDEDNDVASPMALYKKNTDIKSEMKINGTNNDDETDGEEDIGGQNGDKNASHHPLMQLQKLLDKTDNSARRSKNSNNGNNHHRASPFNNNSNWNDSGSVKSPGSSSPRTATPNLTIGQHSPASVKSDQDISTYLQLKCAFCDTPISSRNAYRSHLAKIHLSMRDSIDISAISDEELLLLVLAKSSNISLVNNLASKVATSKSPKESRRKSSRTNDTDPYEKSPNDSNAAATKSPSPPSQLETSQSKFLKYTELAKQLSSKF